ncbi:MAG: zinc ribbon domain-containing protein [Oscillospiraceae bacterium]|nr:zinc ribbon domain-containing protein [Oscillospiraceae bacterium]
MTELLISYSSIVYHGIAPQQNSSSGLDFSGILNAIFSGSDVLKKASDFIDGFGSFLNVFSIIYSICSVIILCYFGYAAFRTLLAIQGFIGGAAIGSIIGLAMGIGMDPDGAVPGAVIGALTIGIIGAALASLLYKLGVFLFFGGGTFIVMLLLVGLGSGGDWSSAMTAGAIVGVIVGVIAVIVDKYFIIAGTAAIGAFTGGSMLMYANTVLGVFAIIFLLVTGILVQVKCTKKLSRRDNEPRSRRNAAQNAPQRHSENFSNLRRCPHCGSLVSVYGTACEKCGSPLKALEPAPRPSLQERLSKAAEDEDEGFSRLRRCPNCGSLVTAFGKTCDKCYAPLDELDEDDKPVNTSPSFQAPLMNETKNFGTAPYFGTAPVNAAPNYSTAPVNSAPVFSAATIFTHQRCPGCNGIIEPGERFCSSCGRPTA